MFEGIKRALIRRLAGPVLEDVTLPLLRQRIDVAVGARKRQEEQSARHWYWTGAIHELTAFKRMLEKPDG